MPRPPRSRPTTPPGAQPLAATPWQSQYHGDLDAASKGEMLGSGDPSKGSAGYVAIEHVTGTLNGHAGSFALQHLGVMTRASFNSPSP